MTFFLSRSPANNNNNNNMDGDKVPDEKHDLEMKYFDFEQVRFYHIPDIMFSVSDRSKEWY